MKIDPEILFKEIIEEHPELNTLVARGHVWEMCSNICREMNMVGVICSRE